MADGALEIRRAPRGSRVGPVRLLTGDALTILRQLKPDRYHACITSPPYFGQRDYGVAGQIGLEPSPDDYIARLVQVFREVRRVLRPDGTLWLNIGDAYAHAGGGWTERPENRYRHKLTGGVQRPPQRKAMQKLPAGLKSKDLIGIARRLEQDVGRLRAPSLPFAVPRGWTHLNTPAALWAVGRELRNCMAPGQFGSGDATVELLNGTAVFLFQRQERVLIRLQAIQHWAWRIAEAAGMANSFASRRLIAEAREALRDAGVVLMDVDLGDALSALLDRGRGNDLSEAEDDETAIHELPQDAA